MDWHLTIGCTIIARNTMASMGQNGYEKKQSDLFKSFEMPTAIMQEIVETLNQVHQDKVEFHNKEFDKLTAEQRSLTKMMDNFYPG